MFTFTDFVNEPELQYKIGWSIIGITLVNVAVNMGLMFYTSFLKFRLLFKKLRYKYRLWKLKRTERAKIESLSETSELFKKKDASKDPEELKVEEMDNVGKD